MQIDHKNIKIEKNEIEDPRSHFLSSLINSMIDEKIHYDVPNFKIGKTKNEIKSTPETKQE